jgi:ABC-type Na+ efflux pump permease subunit
VLGPIFAREFFTVPRRDRHHLSRLAAVLLLWVIGLTAWQATVGFNRNARLGETARFGLLLFQIIVYVELVLLMFFSTLSAASTVSREKDRRTFILLLQTDLRDYEIVVGKMLGSLLPILFLLFATVPVLAMLLLLGGVSGEQVVQATMVLGAISVAAGSLGGLVALWREKTFQSLALSTLFLVLYVCVVQILGAILRQKTSIDDANQIQAWFDPFLALQFVLEPPNESPWNLHPAYLFAAFMFLLCVALNGFGILKLRVWNPSGEPIQQREAPEDEDAEATPEVRVLMRKWRQAEREGVTLSAAELCKDAPEREAEVAIQMLKHRERAHAAPGEVRAVWKNPILWREVATLAYGRRPLLVKFAYGIVLALILFFAIGELESQTRPAFVAAMGLVPVAVLSLLLVAAQAVTSITSERDGRALDLLLVTDISPHEFVFGKLGGVLWNCKEFLIPPLLLAGYYGVRGALASTPRDAGVGEILGLNLGPMICVLGVLLVMFGFAMTLGIHVALRIENSRLAIGHTLGTVFFLCVGTLISIYLIVINGGSLGNQLLSFSAFILLGIGGLWWVLTADRPSSAINIASTAAPFAMFYAVVNILIAKPGTQESSDPLVPFLVIAGAFGFTISAMLTPLLSEFDVTLGRTTVQEE